MNAMKLGTALILTGAIALPAAADDVYYDTAQVLSVSPRTETINSPRQECRTEYERSSSYSAGERDVGGAIIGGIAGGLLGSQVGKGKGRVASAAIGAATGALVGDRIDNSNNGSNTHSTRPIERCTSVDNWQTVTRGYQVTYRYNGRDYTTIMPNDPGNVVRLRIAVTPDTSSNMSYLEPRYRRDDDRYEREHRSGWRDERNEGWHR